MTGRWSVAWRAGPRGVVAQQQQQQPMHVAPVCWSCRAVVLCCAVLCWVKRYCLESLRAAVLRCTKGVWTRSFLPAACPRRNGPYLPTRMHEGMHACMHASKHQHARNARVWRTTMMSMGDDNDDDDSGERLLSSWRTSTGGSRSPSCLARTTSTVVKPPVS